MSLEPGFRFGPYEVIAALAEGGMGEIYKARDTRLDRTVALKVLPERLSADPELRRRFEREARAISALSHPNICTLYDVGHEHGREFLVMEYLEGETLAERIAGGALSLEDVVRYGIDIADALDKAHRQGIIHRDLKPSNIVLTRSGAKLLDFGLAKWMGVDEHDIIGGANDVTQRQPLTAAGMLLGTVPYMSPEQLEGKELDTRTDIFSFGAILYEMATGVRAFDASSNASLIASILRETPVRPSRIRPITPESLDSIIETCLAKNPADRYQSAHDIKLALQMLERSPAVSPVVRSRSRFALLIALAVLIALSAGALGWLLRPHRERRSFRFAVSPPPGSTFASLGEGGGFALSPDGRQLVFAAALADGRSFLWLRALDSEEPKKLEGTEGAEYPFWSPDSRSLAFFAGGKMKRMSVPAGPVETICEVSAARGGTWNGDGVIVFAPSPKGELFRVNASGGQPEALPVRIDGTLSLRWPVFLPDGDHFLFVSQGSPAASGIFVASLSSPATKRVLPSATSVAFAAPDRLLHVRDHVLLEQRFDPGAQTLSGEPKVITDKINFFADRGWVPISIARDGTIAYRRNALVMMRLAWFDRTGRRLGMLGEPGEYEGVSLSPEGNRVAFGAFYPEEGLNHISICNTTDGVPRRFSFNRGNQYSPIWSTDGSQLVFSDDAFGVDTLVMKPASGAGEERPITEAPKLSQYAQAWSRDGKSILFRRDDVRNGLDIAVLPLGSGRASLFIGGPGDQSQAQFSPDGQWVAYASTESGRSEVYVQRFPATGAKWQVSSRGGEQPRWRADGKELFFLGEDRTLMAVPLRGGGVFDTAAPVPLFETTIGVGYLAVSQSYDVTRDGQRFLIAAVDPLTASSGISVVTPP